MPWRADQPEGAIRRTTTHSNEVVTEMRRSEFSADRPERPGYYLARFTADRPERPMPWRADQPEGAIRRTTTQSNEVVTEMRRALRRLIHGNITWTMDAPNPGYLSRLIQQNPSANEVVINNEGVDLDQQIFQPDPMPILAPGIHRMLYESVWNDEFVGHNVGRVVEGSGGNEGDDSNNNEGVDFDEDNLWIYNNEGREGREVYVWSDRFASSLIKQNHNNVWILTAAISPPNAWLLNVTEYNDDTDSEDSI